jgi:hypothetical protein
VRKRGRTSGLTFGTVDTVDLTITLDYGDGIGNRTLSRQVGVRPDVTRSSRFGGPGDSGSVLVDGANRVVGLYFAGDDTSGYGIANPIGPVLSALGVDLCRRTTAPFYRYWNGAIGDHFYTTNWAELNGGRDGFVLDGVQCVIHPSPAAGTVALHRYWNPSVTDHFYSIDFNELGMGRFGWTYEGVAGFVYGVSAAGRLPLHRYWNPAVGDHFYTTDFNELGPARQGWTHERIECYVLPVTSTLVSAHETGDDGGPVATFRTAPPTMVEAADSDRPETFTITPCVTLGETGEDPPA